MATATHTGATIRSALAEVVCLMFLPLGGRFGYAVTNGLCFSEVPPVFRR